MDLTAQTSLLTDAFTTYARFFWRIMYYLLIVFLSEYAQILHSIFGGNANGFYVDGGSNHTIIEKNTFSLYCSSWTGICIDINGIFKLDFKNYSPRDHFIEFAIPANDQLLTVFSNSDPRLRTFLSEVAEHYALHSTHCNQSVTEVTQAYNTLAQVCNGKLPETCHILAVDVEGYESQICSSLHLSDVLNVLVMAEIKTLSLLHGIHTAPDVALLLDLGYVPIAKTPPDTFLVTSDFLPDWIPLSLIHGT
jgi:hypothetical protein